MRKVICLIFLVVLGCGDSNQTSSGWDADRVAHQPEILNLELSSDTVEYMQGGGSIAVTAVIRFYDSGQDIATFMVEFSNGDSLSIDVADSINGLTGTISQQFDVATTEVGTLAIDMWFVDSGGAASNHASARILVAADPRVWIERAAGLPNVLNDVTSWWQSRDAERFVAVGDAGTVLTSEDGITWTEQLSGTTVDLNAVGCTLSGGCFAAGDEGTMLHSSDGENWSLYYDGPDDVTLEALLASGTLVAGHVVTTDTACLLHHDYDSDAWTTVEPLAQSGQRITGLGAIYGFIDLMGAFVEQYVAMVNVPFPDQGRVLVSADGLTWVEVFISDSHESTFSTASTYSTPFFGVEMWVGGTAGHIYSSSDGINWTEHQTPAMASNFVAMASSGNILVAHGFSEMIGQGAQVGVLTADEGQTWQTFVIGSGYESRGLAYSDGRWVSVGQLLSDPGRGAIYTTE